MNIVVKNAGGPYWNKGKQCYWIELHDGTTHKFTVDATASEQEIKRTKGILGEGDPPAPAKAADSLPPITWL